MIPDDVEKIIMTKEDYDRNVEQLLLDKCKAELEVERLNNIIKEIRYQLQQKENIIKEVKSFLDDNTQFDYQDGDYDNHLMEWYEIVNMTENNFIRSLYDILYKENK